MALYKLITGTHGRREKVGDKVVKNQFGQDVVQGIFVHRIYKAGTDDNIIDLTDAEAIGLNARYHETGNLATKRVEPYVSFKSAKVLAQEQASQMTKQAQVVDKDSDYSYITSLTVAELKEEISKIDDPDVLKEMYSVEEANKNRKSVLAMIDERHDMVST